MTDPPIARRLALLAAFLVVLALLAAAPFAWGSYRAHRAEQEGTDRMARSMCLTFPDLDDRLRCLGNL